MRFFFSPCTFSSGLRRLYLTASILSLSLLHQRQACLFFWHCWSSPSHNKRRTPSQLDKDEVIGRRHISLHYQGLAVVIGEETIQSCQLDTHAFSLTDVPSPWWGNEWCPTAVTAGLAPSHPASSRSPDQRDHPSLSRTQPLSRLLHIPRARAGSRAWHTIMMRILIICKMQRDPMPNWDNPCCSLHQSCTHATLQAQDLSTFLTWHRPTDDSGEMPSCSSQLLTFTAHGSLPLFTGSAPPLHHWKGHDSFQVSSHMLVEGLRRALIQTPKLTMDVLLSLSVTQEHLPSFNTSIVLQNSPAFHPSCTVIQTITTPY